MIPSSCKTLLALAGLLATATAGAATGWTITDLGPSHTGTMALNDAGWVVAENRVMSPTAGGYVTTLIRSADGSLTNLQLRDVNNLNVVLGVDRSQNASHAFTWSAGVRGGLPEQVNEGRYDSTAASLNDNGQIAGNSGGYAFQWSPNGSGGYLMNSLGVDLGWTIGSGELVSINGAGAGLMSQVYPVYRTGHSFGIDHTTIIPALPGCHPLTWP